MAGCQRFSARDFPITRVGEAGSWLGREFQADNPASLAVSRKCGYRENGVSILNRNDKPATLQLLILESGNLMRYEQKLTVEGLPEFRRSIGLDA